MSKVEALFQSITKLQVTISVTHQYNRTFWRFWFHVGPTPAWGAYYILPDRILRIIRAWGGRRRREMSGIKNGKGHDMMI